MAFVSGAGVSGDVAGVRTGAVCARRAVAASSRASRARVVVVKDKGEDGLVEDLLAAQKCVDEGCEVDAVQDVLARLEARRSYLDAELREVNRVMAALAGGNMKEDRGAIAELVKAAIDIFSSSKDDYPAVGVQPWTGEKPKGKGKGL
mmetsp:Transcript_12268/g.33086  ORF Transcript_12268/g.33086 Transcript_12268/m.33086 type:complete len:148 (+) Transcript_12268:26-469(+)